MGREAAAARHQVMPISEAADFLAESECLHAALLGRDAATLLRPTQFKGWSIEDVLVHLHFWNHAAEQSATDPVGFARLAEAVRAELNAGRSLRGIEDQRIAARGQGLLAIWIDLARGLAARWAGMDSKARRPWVGPSRSARSSLTARQMETWAHGFEVFDALGLARAEGDRIRNIVVLGVNTFGWSHQVHGLPVPPAMPALRLRAPSGAVWEYGEAAAGLIEGTAMDFAAVVTQTRALEDTTLRIQGEVAATWMAHAQCFAGQPSRPPPYGSRFRTAPD